MKKIVVLIIGIVIILFVVFFVWNNKTSDSVQNNQFVKNIDIHTLPTKDLLLTDGIPDSCHFVKLETTEACMVGHINKMIVTDSLIFIKDYNKNLFVFDLKGKFKSKIGEIGNAANEIITLTDFYVDEQNEEVVLCDILKSQMFHYDYKGNLLRRKKCKNNYLNEQIDIFYYDNETLLLTMTNNPDVEYNYVVLNSKNFSTEKECLPYPIISKTYTQSSDIPKIFKNNKNVYATAFLSDTIYIYNESNFIPALVISSKMKHNNHIVAKLCSDCENPFDAIRILADKGYSYGISKMLATDNHLLLFYCENKIWYKIYWDIDKERGFICKNTVSNNIIASAQYITTTSNAFISVIPAQNLFDEEYKNLIEKNRELQSLFSKTEIEDNPILCFSYIK